MGYRIVYGEESLREKPKGMGILRFQLLTAVFAVLFVLSVRIWWNDGAEQLRHWLLPGEPTVTEAAFSGFVEDIQGGMKVGDAVTAFCKEIISHADVG